MNPIIPIDENARIVVEPLNFTLQFRRKSKTRNSWRTDGYFSDMVSLITYYINMSPQRADNAIKSIGGLIQTIKNAEENIIRMLNAQK
jgi:hypothetical protein